MGEGSNRALPRFFEVAMKVKNNGPDRTLFGLHFAEGWVVEIPDTMPPDKVAYICREFDVVPNAPPPEPLPEIDVEPESIEETFEIAPPRRRRRFKE